MDKIKSQTIKQKFEQKQEYYEKIKSKFKIDKPTNQKFEDNIIKGYRHTPSIAVSKLMQLHFLSDIMSLPEKKRNYFMTDMIFLASKIGQNFGPFGKLY